MKPDTTPVVPAPVMGDVKPETPNPKVVPVIVVPPIVVPVVVPPKPPDVPQNPKTCDHKNMGLQLEVVEPSSVKCGMAILQFRCPKCGRVWDVLRANLDEAGRH